MKPNVFVKAISDYISVQNPNWEVSDHADIIYVCANSYTCRIVLSSGQMLIRASSGAVVHKKIIPMDVPDSLLMLQLELSKAFKALRGKKWQSTSDQ